MARKSPLGKIKDAAVGTIKDPLGTGQKAAGQALGTVTSTVGAVTSKVTGRKRSSAKSEERPKPVAVPDSPSRPHGDPVTPTKAEERALREDSSPRLASVPKQAPAKKTPPPAKQSPAKPAAKKAPAKKAAKAVPTPADVAKKTAASIPTVATAPAKKAPTKKAAPTTKTTAKKAPAKKAPAKKSPAKKRPLTAAELVAGAATDPAANITDPQQPGTAPLMDPGTVKAISKEAEMLRRAADPNKG